MTPSPRSGETSGESLAGPKRRTALEKIGALADDGVIKPVLDRTFPLEAAAEAVSCVESGRAVGKVVIRIADQPLANRDRTPVIHPV